MRSTSCSAPICATCGSCEIGWTGSHADPLPSAREEDRVCQNDAGLRRVGVVVFRGNRLRTRATLERKRLALIEGTDAALVEAGLVDLEVSAIQRIRRQFLDREANCFGRG